MRGLIFSKYKLWKEDHIELQSLLDDYGYTCGYKLNVNELQLKDKFKYMYVEIWDHVCSDSTEKLYHSAKFKPICCVYCGKGEKLNT